MAHRVSLLAGKAKLELLLHDKGFQETLYVKERGAPGESWSALATTRSDAFGGLVYRARVNEAIQDVEVDNVRWREADGGILIQADVLNGRITTTIRPDAEWDSFHYEVDVEIERAVEVERATWRYSALSGAPDFVYTPNLLPKEGDVIGDHRLHSPVIAAQRGPLGFALVAEIDRLSAQRIRRIKQAMDCEARDDGVDIEYGFLDWEIRDHVYYSHRKDHTVRLSNRTLSFGITLFAQNDLEPASAFRKPVRFLYERSLLPRLADAPGQQLRPFDDWERHAWKEYAANEYFEVDVNGVSCAGLSSHRRFVPGRQWRPDGMQDAWFNHWFNSARTSYGMYKSARLWHDRELEEQAIKTVRLILQAPQKEGAFPTVFYFDPRKGRYYWERDNAWAGIRDCYHTFDMAWTGYWLLKWREALIESGASDGLADQMVRFCANLGDFLVKNQLESGCIPSFYHADVEPEEQYLYDENAETAGCATFLLALYQAVGEERYLNAATRALDYVRREIVPRHKWFDYETFFSCSPKPLDMYDAKTRQYPQCALSLMQACLGFLSLYRIRGEKRDLDLGEYLVDYLALFQQVWSPSWLTPNLLGGFATQNTDGEWSDARQCYAADVFFEYFETTQKREYFDRGVAAMRSTFPVAPYENWAHAGSDVHGALTGIHWGTGSATVTVVRWRERYGDVYVHPSGAWGAGLDGCTVRRVDSSRGRVQVVVEDAFAAERSSPLVIGGVDAAKVDLLVETPRPDDFPRGSGPFHQSVGK